MNLKDIAHISGKGGLHRILKPTRSGVIVESLDEKKTKQVVGTQTRVSVLKEISIYTTNADGAESLSNVLHAIYEKYGSTLPVTPDSSAGEQADFLESVLPDFDKDRVYNSDIKRLITWYDLLLKNAPELFIQTEESPTEPVTEEEPETQTDPVTEEKSETDTPVETVAEEKPVKKAKKEKPATPSVEPEA